MEKKRFWELDFLRGFCVILMVIDHFFYSAMDILPAVWDWAGIEFWTKLNYFATEYWYDAAHSVAHFVVVAIFFLICGISCTLTQSNLIRGLRALGLAMGITIITRLAGSALNMGDITVRFGVIHMLSFAMLIYWLLETIGKQIKKINKHWFFDWAGRLFPAAIGLITLIVFFAVPLGHFEEIHSGSEMWRYYDLLPNTTIEGSEIKMKFWSAIIQLKNYSFVSSDYFPILPYAAVVLAGGAIGQGFYKTKHKYALAVLDGKWNKPVCFVGRNALLVYILHQIIVVTFFFCVGAVFYVAA